jgi:hypothetical protein
MYPRYKFQGLCICTAGAAALVAAVVGMTIGLPSLYMLLAGLVGGLTILLGVVHQNLRPRRTGRLR